MRSEFDYEPVPGLPERLPEGETILWQGAPDWRELARRALHTRKVLIYFGILMAWRLIAGLSDGLPVGEVVISVLWLAPAALAAVGILMFLAWASARTTIYTITNRRIVMRFGVAIEKAINFPFTVVESAALKSYPNGHGDIPLKLTGPDGMAYLHLWPHVRPWRYAKAEPMLRAIPDAANVAHILSEALRVAAEQREAAGVRVGIGADKPKPDFGSVQTPQPIAAAE